MKLGTLISPVGFPTSTWFQLGHATLRKRAPETAWCKHTYAQETRREQVEQVWDQSHFVIVNETKQQLPELHL